MIWGTILRRLPVLVCALGAWSVSMDLANDNRKIYVNVEKTSTSFTSFQPRTLMLTVCQW